MAGAPDLGQRADGPLNAQAARTPPISPNAGPPCGLIRDYRAPGKGLPPVRPPDLQAIFFPGFYLSLSYRSSPPFASGPAGPAACACTFPIRQKNGKDRAASPSNGRNRGKALAFPANPCYNFSTPFWGPMYLLRGRQCFYNPGYQPADGGKTDGGYGIEMIKINPQNLSDINKPETSHLKSLEGLSCHLPMGYGHRQKAYLPIPI